MKIIENIIWLSCSFTVGLFVALIICTHNTRADLRAEYERGRLTGYAQGADEVFVALDARFNQGGSLIAEWRNRLVECCEDDPTIRDWINSLDTPDPTDYVPAVEPDTLISPWVYPDTLDEVEP